MSRSITWMLAVLSAEETVAWGLGEHGMSHTVYRLIELRFLKARLRFPD